MEGLVIQVCFSTTKCRCRIQVENRAELLQNLLNSTEYICRGRTSINNSFSHLPESSFHGNLFPIHSPIKCFRFYGHNFQAIRIKKKKPTKTARDVPYQCFLPQCLLVEVTNKKPPTKQTKPNQTKLTFN